MNDRVQVIHADCREAIKGLADCSIDSVVTDGPYALVSIVKRFGKPGSAPVNNAGTKAGNGNDPYLRAAAGFMGKQWDTGETYFDPDFWREMWRVLKPGAHVVAFAGTRTYHRLACAIEDAGFEIRDQIGWAFGSGFPKSHDVSKGIDRAAGAKREVVGTRRVAIDRWTDKGRRRLANGEAGSYDVAVESATTDAARQWEGWGTALKPAWEPICLARKPLDGTVAANVLKYGTGAINIDGCRIETDELTPRHNNGGDYIYDAGINKKPSVVIPSPLGRWPANIILSWPEDEYALRADATKEQKQELFRWLHENA